jgi:hypothetical protein
MAKAIRHLAGFGVAHLAGAQTAAAPAAYLQALAIRALPTSSPMLSGLEPALGPAISRIRRSIRGLDRCPVLSV